MPTSRTPTTRATVQATATSRSKKVSAGKSAAPANTPTEAPPVPRRPRKTGSPPQPPLPADPAAASESAAALIDAKIDSLGDWRGAMLARLRALVREAVPGVVEEWKWQTPVWSHHGLICTGEIYKEAVKMTFAHGASVADPSRLFNSSLEGKVRRAIDFHEGEALDEAALRSLFRAAAARNESSPKRR